MFEDEEVFPLVRNPPILISGGLKDHTEILNVWKNFLEKRPEAKRFEIDLNPAPWTKLYAQPFQFVRNEDVPNLLDRWSKQVDVLLEIH